jgi:hypothetical protein
VTSPGRHDYKGYTGVCPYQHWKVQCVFFLVVQGGKSREKMVKLLASTTPEEILEKLKKEAEKK